jgi:hypothetical protein
MATLSLSQLNRQIMTAGYTLESLKSGNIPTEEERLAILADLKSKMLTPVQLYK